MPLIFENLEAPIGLDQQVASWVIARLNIPDLWEPKDFGPFTGCAIVDRDGQMIGGVVFHGFRPNAQAVEITIATDRTARWATKGNILGILGYAFGLGANRITAICLNRNKEAINMNNRLGFIKEGGHKDYFGPGRNATSFRFMRSDFEKLKDRWKSNGRRRR